MTSTITASSPAKAGDPVATVVVDGRHSIPCRTRSTGLPAYAGNDAELFAAQCVAFWQMNSALSATPPMRGMAPSTASRPESFTATFGFFKSR
jgi:hypothetical protein